MLSFSPGMQPIPPSLSHHRQQIKFLEIDAISEILRSRLLRHGNRHGHRISLGLCIDDQQLSRHPSYTGEYHDLLWRQFPHAGY